MNRRAKGGNLGRSDPDRPTTPAPKPNRVTREFGEAGRSDWAVHIALVVNGTPDACAVALPAQDNVVFSTATPPALAPASDAKLRLLSLSRRGLLADRTGAVGPQARPSPDE